MDAVIMREAVYIVLGVLFALAKSFLHDYEEN